MNPLGWKSAVYDLARAGDQPMADVSDGLLQRLAAGGDAPTLAGDRLVAGLGASRGAYADFLALARSQAVPEGELATQLSAVASRLKAAEGIRELPGPLIGQVRAARMAAEDVVENLARGIGPAHADESTHVAMWSLRNNLDEAWNELGVQKVMGGLRGQVSL